MLGKNILRIEKVHNTQLDRMRFCGFKAVTPIIRVPQKNDVFVRQYVEKENFINNLYTKIESNLLTICAEDISKSVQKFSEKTGLSEDVLYKNLYRKTAYASYKSLEKLQNEFLNRGIENIKGELSHDENVPNNFPICLTSVFNYIFRKNIQKYNFTKKENNIIVDFSLLEYLEKMNTEQRTAFIKEKLKNPKWIYIEDFENGYNFLNREKNFENILLEIENYDTNYNEKIINKAKKIGLELTLIPNKLPQKINAETISSNLQNIMPSKKKFEETINLILKEYNDIEGKKYILNFIDKMLFIISPSTYNEYLRDIKLKIDSFIKQKHINSENIYYLIPDIKKSFITTLYQYKQANKIENTKCIYPKYDKWYCKSYDIENIPDNSAIVILDDCIITGLTMEKDVFKYSEFIRKINSLNKNLSIIISSVTAGNKGIDNLNNIITNCKRESFDTIITGSILPQWNIELLTNYEKYLNLTAPISYITALVLPHMGPDTNIPLLYPLIHKFLFSQKAQSHCCPNFDFPYGFQAKQKGIKSV